MKAGLTSHGHAVNVAPVPIHPTLRHDCSFALAAAPTRPKPPHSLTGTPCMQVHASAQTRHALPPWWLPTWHTGGCWTGRLRPLWLVASTSFWTLPPRQASVSCRWVPGFRTLGLKGAVRGGHPRRAGSTAGFLPPCSPQQRKGLSSPFVNAARAYSVCVCWWQLQALSPVGRCKSFDASGDGYGRGEGFVAVVLQPLGRSHDTTGSDSGSSSSSQQQPIAIICGSAVNQAGRSSGLTAPNGLAQSALIRAALAAAAEAGSRVRFLSVHGTGRWQMAQATCSSASPLPLPVLRSAHACPLVSRSGLLPGHLPSARDRKSVV